MEKQLKTIIKTLEQLVTKVDRLESGQQKLESGQDKILELIDAKTAEVMQVVNSDKQYSHQAFQWIGKLQAEVDRLKEQVASMMR